MKNGYKVASSAFAFAMLGGMLQAGPETDIYRLPHELPQGKRGNFKKNKRKERRGKKGKK